MHELFQCGFDGCKVVGLMCLTLWLKEDDSFSKEEKIKLCLSRLHEEIKNSYNL